MLWTVWIYRRTAPVPRRGLRRALTALRAGALLLLLAAVAGPVVSRLYMQVRPAELAVICEDSGSMALSDAGAAGDRTRWSRALAVAAVLDSVAGQLPTPVRTVLLRGNGVAPLAEFRLSDPVIAPPQAHGTDLAGLRRQVVERMASRPLRATVLLADGQETVDQTRRAAPEGVGAGATSPFHTVGVGDENGPADRLLKDLRFPDTAYEGDEIVVEFAVDHRYLPGESGAVTGPRPIAARLVGPQGTIAERTVTSGQNLVPFELAFRPDAVGLQAYELQVDLLDNERFPANNRASMVINVRQDRARVLLLADRPAWDVRFLLQAAAREQRLAVSVVHPTAGGLVLADSLTPWRVPGDAAEWGRWDAVILTGWTGPWAGLNWADVGMAVQQGLGLLVMAGTGGGPGGGPNPFPPPAGLADLLPVTVESWRWLPGPLFVEDPGTGGVHPLLDGLVAGRGGFGSLPPLTAVAVVGLKAGSELLLGARTGRTENTGGADPVLVAAESGQGRVVWFGGRHLWELAFWEPGRADAVPTEGGRPSSAVADASEAAAGHAGRRLARNLLVWTASGTEEAGLAFVGRQSYFEAGEPVRLGAQWLDMRGQPVTDRPLSLILKGVSAAADSAAERTFALPMNPLRPGIGETTLPPLPPGRYTVQLVGGGEPPVLGGVENLIISDQSAELTQVRLDRRRLVQLAEVGGGRYFAADDEGDLQSLVAELEAMAWSGEESVQRRRWSLRAGWPLLLLVTLLLSAEWYLRRRHGLL